MSERLDREPTVGPVGGSGASDIPTVGEVKPTSRPDMVAHPPHYTSDPSGVECITITRHRNFNVGNAIKYLWRAGLKPEVPMPGEGLPDHLMPGVSLKKQIEDLRKAVWYIEDEIGRLESSVLEPGGDQ